MIKFFRKIRQNLLMENKTSKYLKYAIGEILLVIIGILIALQINNWNQDRLNQKKELRLVKQLLNDAKADSIFFQDRLYKLSSQLSFYQDILNLCNEQTISNSYSAAIPVSDQPFIRLASQSNLLINNPDAYSRLSNVNVKLSLQKYSAQYEFIRKSINFFNTQIEEYITPLKIKYYAVMPAQREVKSVNEFGFICENKENQGIINLMIENTKNSIDHTNRFLSSNQELSNNLRIFIRSKE